MRKSGGFGRFVAESLHPTLYRCPSGEKTITVRFGRRLQTLRKKRGWTQVEMAERLGIDRSYISDMERGKKNVCLPTLEVIALGLETTISRVLSGL